MNGHRLNQSKQACIWLSPNFFEAVMREKNFPEGLEETQTPSKQTNHDLLTPNRDFLGDAP